MRAFGTSMLVDALMRRLSFPGCGILGSVTTSGASHCFVLYAHFLSVSDDAPSVAQTRNTSLLASYPCYLARFCIVLLGGLCDNLRQQDNCSGATHGQAAV